jgi:hypothetical protein
MSWRPEHEAYISLAFTTSYFFTNSFPHPQIIYEFTPSHIHSFTPSPIQFFSVIVIHAPT